MFSKAAKKNLKPIHVGIPHIIPFDKGPKAKTNLRRLKVGKKGGGIHRESLSDGLRMVEVFGNV